MSFDFFRQKAFKLFSNYKLHPVDYFRYREKITVTAKTKSSKFDVSENLGLVGLKPLVLAFSEFERDMDDILSIQIEWDNKPISILFLLPFEVKIPGFCLYKISNSKNQNRNFLRNELDLFLLKIRDLFRKKIGFSMTPIHLKHLFNFCVFPRKVFLLSCYGTEEESTFPIDVVGIFPNETVLFSVRNSSKMNLCIQSNSEVLLSESPLKEVDRIYNLGKNYTSEKKSLKSVKYLTYREINFPDFSVYVNYIEIISFFPIGEHTCYFGKIRDKIHQKNDLRLAHVPWFWKDNFQG